MNTINSNPFLYGYPDMGRTGLGHSLLAWGRCAVWCRDTGATMLAPRWLRPRIGPYLRGERDKRNYFLLFQKGHCLGEPSRSIIMAKSAKLYAELDLPDLNFSPSGVTVVIFRNAQAANERKMFHFVSDEGPFLHNEFVSMVKPKYRAKPVEQPFIAAHIRMGDFGQVTPEELKAGATNSRLPVEWYAKKVTQLRVQLGRQLPLVVFSDGSDNNLSAILSLPNTVRSHRQQSVTDMLQISQAVALVASNSGFSRWGSFFGSVPRINYPGQSLGKYVTLPIPDIESDMDDSLPQDFIAAVEAKFNETGLGN